MLPAAVIEIEKKNFEIQLIGNYEKNVANLSQPFINFWVKN